MPVQTLRAAPFSLPYDKLVTVKVRARNQFGFGDYSEVNTVGARIQVEPVQMPPMTLDIVASTIHTIKLDWSALVGPDTGSSPILSYHLQMDSGVGWADIRGQDGHADTTTTYTVGALTPGSNYNFRVRASNVHGWGPYSTQQTFMAAQRPEKPLTVETSLTNLKIRITWHAPNANYQAITAYKILIQNHDGSGLFETLDFCDGSDPAIVS